ncbi:MAG: tRNA (guanine-N7)-methyltransferase, partial [Wolbachia sp.]
MLFKDSKWIRSFSRRSRLKPDVDETL